MREPRQHAVHDVESIDREQHADALARGVPDDDRIVAVLERLEVMTIPGSGPVVERSGFPVHEHLDVDQAAVGGPVAARGADPPPVLSGERVSGGEHGGEGEQARDRASRA